MTKPAVTKETGFRHFFAAASYSWAGFLRAAREIAETGRFDRFAEAVPSREIEALLKP